MSIQNEARLKLYWASPDSTGQAPPLLEPTRYLTMRGRARANSELEVIVWRPEEAAEEPTDQLQPAPLPVEPADAPAVSN